MPDSGYSITEGVFSGVECEELISELATASRSRAGARHLMSIPAIAAFARDPRLVRLAAAELGGQATAFKATLFEKNALSNWLVAWHQDTALPLAHSLESAEWGPWSTKAGVRYAHAPAWALERIIALRVHLDPSTSGNGPLRVIPDSHRAGVLSDAEISRLARVARVVECVVDRGGVLSLRPLLVHASSKARFDQPRRVIHIEYAASLELGRGVQLAVA